MSEREDDKHIMSDEWVPYFAIVLFAVVALLVRPDLFAVIAVCFAALMLGVSAMRRLGPEPLDTRSTKVASSVNYRIYHSVIDALQYPVFLIDQNARVEYLNPAARAAFKPIGVGDSITNRFRQPSIKNTIQSALETETTQSTLYNEPVPDDRWYTVEISPIPATGLRRYVLGFHDQTEARRIDRMRSDFIANASHELRTPLASLLGFIETLKGPAKNDTEARERFTDVMLEQAERMTRLVNDLLSLSRIEMQAHQKPSEAVDLSEVLHTVAKSLSRLAEQMNVEIELAANQSVWVDGDRDELVQVFENLLENACKYGQEGKRVIVQLEEIPQSDEKKSHAIVSVKDFGPGIAEEHQNRITERFYRVDVARSREKQGTGLGLAIVKHILNRHGTRLGINSSPGQGAEFTVRFPLRDMNSN